MCVGGGEKKGVKERERCWSVEGVKKRVVMVGGRGRRRGTRERKWGGREWKRKKGEGKDEEKGERKSQSPKSEAANLDVFFFLDFGHFLVLLET